MKKLSVSAVSGFLFKSLLVLALIVAAGVLGVGVAGFIAYHEIGATPGFSRSTRASAPDEPEITPRLIPISHLNLWQGQKIAMNVEASLAANRFVAANSSDKPQFTYADYRPDDAPVSRNGGRSATTMVPPPLEPTAEAPVAAEPAAPVASKNVARLTDPGSRFIVDENTGRVIGVDGTAGAAEEARQRAWQEQQQAAAAPRREREVRAALPVEDTGSNLPPPKPDLYPAVRRALPVDEPAPEQAQAFNASSEVSIDDRPVYRAEPVVINQPVRKPPRLFTLP